jgi:hypothetical protein
MPRPEPAAASPDGLTDDQVRRLAALVADRDAEFPAGLSPADHARVAEAVRDRLARRLVHHIARALAADLRRDGRAGQEDHAHG